MLLANNDIKKNKRRRRVHVRVRVAAAGIILPSDLILQPSGTVKEVGAGEEPEAPPPMPAGTEGESEVAAAAVAVTVMLPALPAFPLTAPPTASMLCQVPLVSL
jgi:hypothetical protein